jgi:DNA repair photolyase
MTLKAIDQERVIQLISRIDPKYRAVWENRPVNAQIALAQYYLPHGSNKPVIGPTRPRIIKWYCPFASQHDFPAGHRYCVNVYTGCSHKCTYCYAAGYEPESANSKKSFEKLIGMDMDDIERFDVPPAPVHLSNSTDPFQPLEKKFGHTRYALEQILKHRYRFTTVTILTKNPMLPVQLGYIELLKALLDYQPDHSMYQDTRLHWPSFVVEVSLAFWQETARSFYDPGAPTLEQRIEGAKALHRAGIPLVLRIDPLFPRSPITDAPAKNMTDFGLPEAQTIEDLENLVSLAKEIEAKHIVYSTAKIVQPRGRKLSPSMRTLRDVYTSFAAPEKLIWRGGSWRLPYPVANEKILRPFLEICQRRKITVKFCKQNLIETP